ncbi:MAG: calcium-binding protein [Nitrospira sp.]
MAIEVLERLGVTANTVPSGVITNIISENGLSVASGLGTQIGNPVNIFIEETGLNTSFHDHQIATATDALAWYDLAATIDPTIDIAAVTRLLEASSSVAARRLETGLDTLRFLFTGDRTPTPIGPSGTGDPNREAYYVNLMSLRNSLPSTNDYRFVDLVGLSSSTIFSQAKSLTPEGLAYRYTLRELNPFVMTGIDYEVLHNQDHSLDIYDTSTGTGVWTQMALSDRAELLAEKLRFNVSDGTASSPTLFVDETTNFNNQRGATAAEVVIFGDAEGREYLGRRGNDHIYGGAGNDFIHGAAGQDYLEGNDGDDELYGEGYNDILVGQQGNDTLDGGAGVDSMSGGAGDDIYIVDNLDDKAIEIENGGRDEVRASTNFSLGAHVENLTLTGMGNTSGTGNNLDNRIIGNSGNNRLTGKGGNDLLEGGVGFDTYVYSSGDGTDRIEDSDARGQIVFDGRVLQGGIRRAGDAGNTYTSLDGQTTYVMSGTDLIVNGVLIVNENFQSGQMGIELRDKSGMPRDSGGPTGSFIYTYIGSADAEEWVPGPGAIEVYANGGNDVLHGDHAPILGAFDDLLDGGAGNDVFFGGYGNDYLIGGYGDDYALLTDGDMFLGGDGDDYAVGTANYLSFAEPIIGGGAHYADGGAGNDTLMGAMGADVLLGGDGNDVLRGENRPTGWIGLVYDNSIWNRTAQAGVISLSGSDDYLDGGAGNDLLVGDGGNDILLVEPVTIGCTVSRILLKRLRARIGLMGAKETIRCSEEPERTCSLEVMEMIS